MLDICTVRLLRMRAESTTTVTASAVLIYFLLLISCLVAMDRLSLFNGVRSGLSRSEFTELLGVFPIDSLRSLRAGLFNDACDLGLYT